MANLTANKPNQAFFSERHPSRIGVPIQTAIQTYGGSYMGIGTRENATAAKKGFALPWTPAAGLIPLGFTDVKVLGTSVAPLPETTIERIAGTIGRKFTVTGVTGRSDFGRPVYMTDDNTFTLTRGACDTPVGFISYWYTGTSADIYFYSLAELMVIAMGGHAKGQFQVVCSAVVAASGVVGAFTAPHHGRITAVDGTIVTVLAGAGASLSYGVKIGGVALTGGAVAAVLADVQGDIKAGSAVIDDGGNVFHEGDAVTVYCTKTTTSTAGLVMVNISYVREPGL